MHRQMKSTSRILAVQNIVALWRLVIAYSDLGANRTSSKRNVIRAELLSVMKENHLALTFQDENVIRRRS